MLPLAKVLKERITDINGLLGFLFAGFRDLYPSTRSIIKNDYDLANFKSSWGDAFLISGLVSHNGNIDFNSFVRGYELSCCLNQTFMPSCGQFIHLCLHGQESKDDQSMVLS